LILRAIHRSQIHAIGVTSTFRPHQGQCQPRARHGHVEKAPFVLLIPAPVGAVHHDDVIELHVLDGMRRHQLYRVVPSVLSCLIRRFVREVEHFGGGNDVRLQRRRDIVKDDW
jgi:hypothetical protein